MTSRILSIIYIIYSLEVGVALLLLPWLGIWDNNLVLYLCPKLEPVVTNPFFKGAVLGLGIDNLLIGLYEVINFRSASHGLFLR